MAISQGVTAAAVAMMPMTGRNRSSQRASPSAIDTAAAVTRAKAGPGGPLIMIATISAAQNTNAIHGGTRLPARART